MRLHLSVATCATSVLLWGCTAAQAAGSLSEGASLYGGGSLGAVVVKPDDYKIDSKHDNDGKAAGGAFVGVRLARLPVSEGWPLFLELGYQDIARHTIRYKVQSTTSDLTASGYAVSLASRLSIPLTSNFGLYGKLGLAHTKVTSSTPAGQPAISVNGSGTGFLHAFGVEYQFDSGPILRSEIAGYSMTSDKSTAAAFSLGLGFRF